MDHKDRIELVKIFGGISIVFLSARLAISKFYKGKWWEKRVDYFLKVIDAVYLIKESDSYYYRDLDVMQMGPESDPGFSKLSAAEKVELKARADTARDDLKRLAHLGPYS